MLNLEKGLHIEVGKIHDVQHFKQMEAINTFPPRNTPGGQLKHADSSQTKQSARESSACWFFVEYSVCDSANLEENIASVLTSHLID